VVLFREVEAEQKRGAVVLESIEDPQPHHRGHYGASSHVPGVRRWWVRVEAATSSSVSPDQVERGRTNFRGRSGRDRTQHTLLD